MLLIGIDYGLRHIGISVGDTVSKSAKPLCGFKYRGEELMSKLQEIIERWQPEKVIVGLPLNADGTNQPLTEKVFLFVNALSSKFGLPVECVDERWSTVEAKASLHSVNKTKKVSKSMVDAESARLILEQWLFENA
ncbi:MAG: Holliday junction resolvase RuvX [Gammaproteobacteria bacterium]|nr:Holliday junction resolvase RuvX [Gammaproteobacteria bacterium]